MDTQRLNQRDPLQKQPWQGIGGENMSPMDPPEATSPPTIDRVDPAKMHPFLRKLCEEHVVFMEELKMFEEAILAIQQDGFTKKLDSRLRHFFHFFDHNFVPHSRREEAALFPLLNARLIAGGEHSPGEHPTTAVNLMEDDHLKAVQLAAVVLNFMGLAFRLPDQTSRLVVLDAALEQGKNLVELMRLHIFREDNVVFASAHKLVSESEFDQMQKDGI